MLKVSTHWVNCIINKNKFHYIILSETSKDLYIKDNECYK